MRASDSEMLLLTGIFSASTSLKCRTQRGDEFTERPACAVNGAGSLVWRPGSLGPLHWCRSPARNSPFIIASDRTNDSTTETET